MKMIVSMIACLLLLAVGCSQPESNATNNEHTNNIDGTQYLLPEEPEGAVPVIQLRESAKDGDEILIVGRIGGEKNPWVDGRAAFTIVDPSLTACNEIPGDNCPNPWDFCCASNLSSATVLVELVDAEGQPIKADARQLLNLTELNTVIAKGTAQRDENGNLTVIASHLYVKK
jgi:hypothetical protein